jgi:uncharacterized membrane protein YoaK (UPF0700 family)
MIRYNRQARALAISLSALAGYVDAVGFIASGGFFVSFMSGNSTRLAVSLFDFTPKAVLPAVLIGTFVFGVFSGSVLGHIAGHRRRAALLVLLTCLLVVAAICDGSGHVWPTVMCLAFAMGAENAVFERNGETGIGLTYMTGSLVRLGHGLAGLVIGQPRPGWGAYAVLWLGLVSGAILGAVLYSQLHTMAIWLASGVAGALAIWALGMKQEFDD